MLETLKALLQAFKLKPAQLVAVAVLCLAALAAQPEQLQFLGLRQLVEEHRAVIGGVLAVAVGMLIVAVVQWLAVQVARQMRQRRIEGRVQQRLRCLTEDEKNVLRGYLREQTRTRQHGLDDGVVQGLVAAGVLWRSAAVSDRHMGFAHNLTDPAWKILQEDHALLD